MDLVVMLIGLLVAALVVQQLPLTDPARRVLVIVIVAMLLVVLVRALGLLALVR